MQQELITDSISDFAASDRMLLLKEKLHRFLPAHVIGQLAPDNLDRVKGYLYPVSIEEIRSWTAQFPCFWFWLICPNSQALRQERMKSKAMDVIDDVLRGAVPDPKLAAVQLNAAKMLLSIQEKPGKSVTNNNLTVSKGASNIPKNLAKKSTGEIASEIAKLTGGLSQLASED